MKHLFSIAMAALVLAIPGCKSPETHYNIASLEISAETIDHLVAQLDHSARADKDQTIKLLVTLMGKVAPFSQLTSAQKQQLAEQIWNQYFAGTQPAPAPTPNPGTPPTPPPASSAWQTKLQGQMLYYGAPDYFFHYTGAAEARRFCTAIRDAGLTGPEFEFSGQPVVDEYNGKKYTPDLDALYKAAFDSFANYLGACRELGLVCNVKFLNSNQSFANTRNDAWWKAKAAEFVRRFGPANIIVLPLNETDSRNWFARTFAAPRTRSSIGTAIRAGLIEGGMPKAQLIGYGSKGDNGFLEHHPQKSDASDLKGGGHTTINCTDSGKPIAFLYGSDWRNGGKPNTANITAYAKRVKASGTSGAIYSFHRATDYTGLAAAGAGWRAREPITIDTSVRRAAVVAGCRVVDPAAYGGWKGDCPGADVDAQNFAALCRTAGIQDTVLLLNEAATLQGIYTNAAYYVHGMGAGDLLVLYFSGHGGQTNDVSGDETDGKDETICLFDGELEDDYVANLLAELPEGLRVLMVTDNCNSGSNYRSRDYARAAAEFRGQLIHFGGCDDGQSSYGDDQGGLFTTALLETWRPRRSYEQWFQAAKRRTPRAQVPTYRLHNAGDTFPGMRALQ